MNKLHKLQPGFTISIYLCFLSGVIERWELLQAQSRSEQHAGSLDPQQLTSHLDDITSWLETVIPALENHQKSDSAASIEDMTAKAKDLKVSLKPENHRSDKKLSVFVAVLTDCLSQELHKMFTRYKSIMLSINLRAQEAPELQGRLGQMNRDWSRACTSLQQWDTSLRKTLMRCQVRLTKQDNSEIVKSTEVLDHDFCSVFSDSNTECGVFFICSIFKDVFHFH